MPIYKKVLKKKVIKIQTTKTNITVHLTQIYQPFRRQANDHSLTQENTKVFQISFVKTGFVYNWFK